MMDEEEGDLLVLNAWCEQLSEEERAEIIHSTLMLAIRAGWETIGEVMTILVVSLKRIKTHLLCCLSVKSCWRILIGNIISIDGLRLRSPVTAT